MATNPIQWFPGHMAKTRRVMKECLPEVDLVLELLDARIPYSSKNPEIESMLGTKPRITVMTKATLADPDKSAEWVKYYKQRGITTVLIDSTTGAGTDALAAAVRTVMTDKLASYEAKGMKGRKLKAMIVGIPNVGKSSLINRLAGAKKAKVENRPGVTLDKQWVATNVGLMLLDMPGVLWPKFESHATGLALAVTGAIKDQILDLEEISCRLLETLSVHYSDNLKARYKITDEDIALPTYDLFECIGKRRGFRLSGGDIDTERTAKMLLDEFRRGILGKISLEWPKGEENA